MRAQEIEEMEYHLNARADYFSEALGAEARCLADQAADEERANSGYFSFAGQKDGQAEWLEKRRAANAISRAHWDPGDNCPF